MCKEFLISEHSSLRNEILSLTTEISTLQRSALYLSGGLWAWFVSQENYKNFYFILWLPAVISTLILLRICLIKKLISHIDGYLSNIEKKLNLPDNLGWESYLEETSKGWNYFWNILYWIFLIGGNIFLIFFIRNLTFNP